MDKTEYKKELRKLQIELVKLQRHIIRSDRRVLVIFEGRDASGKDGAIKRITAHLSPRETRVVALGKPTERENRAWYFQRYVAHLPVDGEFVLFNRSWYNRAGVEKVMGFCTDEEYATFMTTVTDFERLLIRSGVQLLKYYLDISKEEQIKRLQQRRQDPLTQWKISPIDESSVSHWDDYSKARDEMLRRTNTPDCSWYRVMADHKKPARLNIIKDILQRLEYPDRESNRFPVDSQVVFPVQ